jgi:glucokinase
VSLAGRVVALDVGGTHVSAATVDLASGVVVPASRVRADLVSASDRQELLTRIGDTASAARSEGVEAACVAVPGPFDYARGICLVEHKLESLYGVDLRTELAAVLRLRPEDVRFLNDAEAFLLGEWWRGAAQGHDRAIGITIGSGLGSAFLEGGLIVRRGSRVPPDGALYRLLFRDAPVEARISGGAVRTRYGDERVEVEEIARRARDGEREAREAFAVLSTDLADFVRPWVRAFSPTCLVVGGSIARSWDLLQGGIESLQADVAFVAPAEYIDDAPLLGAARYAVTERAP